MNTLSAKPHRSQPGIWVQAVTSIGWAAVSVLIGGAVGGLVGEHCEYCSADVTRLTWGAGTTAALLICVIVAAGWRRRWVILAVVAIATLPAMYYSASLAQTVGLWWDRL